MLRFGLPALVVLALVAVALAAQGEDRGSPGRRVAPPDPEPPVATAPLTRAALVRGPDDSRAAARRLARLRGVRRTALVGRGTALVSEVRARDGRTAAGCRPRRDARTRRRRPPQNSRRRTGRGRALRGAARAPARPACAGASAERSGAAQARSRPRRAAAF